MAFNPEEPIKLGKVLVKAGYGVADGIDLNDGANAMELLQAFMATINEFQEDADAAFFHVVEGISGEMALRRRNPETPE